MNCCICKKQILGNDYTLTFVDDRLHHHKKEKHAGHLDFICLKCDSLDKRHECPYKLEPGGFRFHDKNDNRN